MDELKERVRLLEDIVEMQSQALMRIQAELDELKQNVNTPK